MMRKLPLLLLIWILILSLSACAPAPVERTLSAMDTFMSLKIYGDEDIADTIEEQIHTLDQALSVTDRDSEIYAVNHQSGAVPLSQRTADILARSLSLCDELGGDLDITVYPVVSAWGFTTAEYRVPDREEIAALLPYVDYSAVTLSGDTVTVPDGMALDLGAVAKGRCADEAVAALARSSADSAVLNLGGIVAAFGHKPDGSPWRIGIADPDNPSSYFGYLSCADKIVATSGGYERYFERDGVRYIHIIDPATGYPVDNGILSVTVVADSGLYADALSTALFVKGIEGAMAYYEAHRDFDLVILTQDLTLYLSDGIADSFSLSDGYDFSIERI